VTADVVPALNNLELPFRGLPRLLWLAGNIDCACMYAVVSGGSGWRSLSLVQANQCMPTSPLESVSGTHLLVSACK